jgi:hypothetical protein
MSKRYNDPIKLRISPAKRPEAFIWRGRQYQIEAVIRRWTVNGDWWRQPTARRLHAVVTAKHYGQVGQYELVYETGRRQWYLRSIYD